MREILFRGKRMSDGEWLYGSLLQVNRKGATECCIHSDRYSHLIDHATVGQFTGLTDKNGKRIFEGDIVKGLFLFGMEVRSVVTFMDGAFGLLWQRGNVPEFSAFTSICNVEYEVIGNVHDNGWEERRDAK